MGGHARNGTWSLSVEVFFYALFPLILFHARNMSDRALTLGIRWAVGLTFGVSVFGKYIQPMDTFTQFAIGYSIPIYRLPEFVAGAFAGVLALRDTTPAPSGRRSGRGARGRDRHLHHRAGVRWQLKPSLVEGARVAPLRYLTQTRFPLVFEQQGTFWQLVAILLV